METIEDIVREMRMFKCRNLETGELELCSAIAYYFADRIEAAVKALIEDRDNWRKQALAEDARANQQKDWRKICAACQEGEPPEDCEFYGEPDGCNARPRCVHPTCKESLQVGNSAKMREALLGIQKEVAEMAKVYNAPLETIASYVNDGLVPRPRNCDLYADFGDALRAFEDDEDAESYEDIGEWLFEKAKGEAK